MIRRHGEPPRRGVRYRLRPGVYALLPLEGRLLVTFQHAPIPEHQLPGGGIDAGESPLRALHREVFEETGWRIGTPRRLGAYRRFTWMPDYGIWAEKLCQVFVARPVRPLGPPAEPGHTARFIPVGQAPALLSNAGDRDFAARFL